MSGADQSVPLTKAAARRIWLRAQRLDARAPFGEGPAAVAAAVEHLGYVQIDTINVIERCHHHILWNRIPAAYRRADLRQARAPTRACSNTGLMPCPTCRRRICASFLHPALGGLHTITSGFMLSVRTRDGLVGFPLLPSFV